MAVVMILLNTAISSYNLIQDICFYKNNDPEKICSKKDEILGDNGICTRRQIVITLQKLGEMPLNIKKHTAIYIPKNNQYYWRWGEIGQFRCYIVPYISTMLTGIALLHGTMSQECAANIDKDHMYIYDNIKKIYSDKELCTYAQRWGIYQVFVLNSKPAKFSTKLIKCGK